MCSRVSCRQLVVLGVWGRKEKSTRTKRARQVQPSPEGQGGTGPKGRTLNVSDAPRYLWGRWRVPDLGRRHELQDTLAAVNKQTHVGKKGVSAAPQARKGASRTLSGASEPLAPLARVAPTRSLWANALRGAALYTQLALHMPTPQQPRTSPRMSGATPHPQNPRHLPALVLSPLL